VNELCGVLAAFDLVVSNDSGVAHLSAALGRPTVAVFGPSNVFRWAPRGIAAVAVPPKLGADWPSIGEVLRGCNTAVESREEPGAF
jgi:heptosyltransferase-2